MRTCSVFCSKMLTWLMVEKFISEGPWTIDGYWLTLKKWNLNEKLEDIDLDTINLWIQIHVLEPDQTPFKNELCLWQMVGRVSQVESLGEEGCIGRRFMRVRVEMKVNE